MRISDWSSDVCSSDLTGQTAAAEVEAVELDLRRTMGGSRRNDQRAHRIRLTRLRSTDDRHVAARSGDIHGENVAPLVVRAVHDTHREHQPRSEEHTSELQSLMRISYAVFCLKNKKHNTHDR